MKTISLFCFALMLSIAGFSQIDKDQLALDVSKADAQNTQQLEKLIWKRYSTATVDGEVKGTLTTELSFNEHDSLIVTPIDQQTTVKQKPGVRGKIQENTAQENMDYVGEALQLSINYVYMSKGQLIDFFDKGTVTENNGIIEIKGTNVLVKGDALTIHIDATTNLFLDKHFTSTMDNDPVSGDIVYEKFSNGVNHISTTSITLPAKKALISAVNKDYTARIE